MVHTNTILAHNREAPSIEPLANAVNWAIFRRRPEAEEYARNVRLGENHELIGGHGHDSIGDYWWIGVQVPSVHDWGSPQAINKHGRHDGS